MKLMPIIRRDKRNAIRASLVVLAAASATVGAVLVSGALSEGNEPDIRFEREDTGPSGQPGPIDVGYPNYPANPDEPIIRGPFRLLPFGYFDPPTTAIPTAYPTCATAAIDRSDPAFLRTVDLYAQANYVPPGFTYQPPSASRICGTAITEIRWSFPGVKASTIDITRFHQQLPVDIRIPPPDSWVTLEEGTVQGFPAIFLRNKEGQFGPQAIYYVDGDLLTTIIGDVADFNELLLVAGATQSSMAR